MITFWHSGKTVVRHLRIRSRNLDPLVAQLRMDNLLQGVDLHPAWLAPSAIVCLRRLRDPLPGALNLTERNETRSSRAWQRAVCATIEEKVRRAAHPFDEEFSAENEAVIFRDRAELLACLARDWAEGRVQSRWWWRSLFKNQEVERVLSDAWLSAPQYVPAALELLALNRGLKPFMRSLSTNLARALLKEVTRSFALIELQSALSEGLEEPGHIRRGLTEAARLRDALVPGISGSPDSVESGKTSSHRAPWHSLVPESRDGALCVERKCLLGVALMIRRSHSVARSTAFAQATLRWLLNEGSNGSPASDNSSAPEMNGEAALEEHLRRDNAQRESDGLLRDSVVAPTPCNSTGCGNPLPERSRLTERASQLAVGEESSHDWKDSASRTGHAQPSSLSTDPGAVFTLDPRGAEALLGRPSLTAATFSTEQNVLALSGSVSNFVEEAGASLFVEGSSASCTKESPWPGEVEIVTEVGGIFYFINLALFLELYDDFTMTRKSSGLSLSVFDFIALLGLRLLGESIKADPVWKLLAQLAGRRTSDEPGAGFEPPLEWRLPAQWLEAFPEACTLDWMAEGERLLVKHPAGFLLLDVQLSGGALLQLKSEMEVYGEQVRCQLRRSEFEMQAHSDGLNKWLDLLVPYVRARLSKAFGITKASDAGQLLCEERARLRATATHLDIFFALSGHPLEIRLAGLDRNPGWLPAAGRYITFHYD